MVRFRINFEPLPTEPKIIPDSVRILAFNITDKCNLKCPHCFAEDKRIEMTTDECKNVILQAKSANCVRVILCGKEPMMRKDIYDILAFISEQKMDVELMTNGTLIDQTAVDRLRTAGVRRAQISIDGFEKTHDKLRGMKGSFELAKNSIRLFVENDFKTSVNTVVLRSNWKEIPKLIDEHMKEFPEIKEWRLSRLIPTRFNNPDYDYFEIYKMALTDIMKFLESIEIPFHVEIEDNPIVFDNIIPPRMKEIIKYTPCGVITHTIDVLNNGDVVFCVPMGSHANPFIHGNILKDGLEKIMRNIRKYKNNDVDDTVCHSCEHYRTKCLGGCRCVAYSYRKNEYLADPFCPKIQDSS